MLRLVVGNVWIINSVVLCMVLNIGCLNSDVYLVFVCYLLVLCLVCYL